jgi:hypothetical protein
MNLVCYSCGPKFAGLFSPAMRKLKHARYCMACTKIQRLAKKGKRTPQGEGFRREPIMLPGSHQKGAA